MELGLQARQTATDVGQSGRSIVGHFAGRLAVETNLPGIDDERARSELAEAVAVVDDLTGRADAVEEAVRGTMRR